jgi:rhodanese-related sulfurtransferase
MSLPTITPAEAKRLVDAGAVLVDVRERDEHARERIPGARNVALSGLEQAELEAGPGKVVLFHCKSGMRTLGNAGKLAAKAGEGCDAYVVEGGLDAWRKAGLPVEADAGQPLELMRQVQIGAGSTTGVGTVLGVLVDPAWLIVPAFVGVGLTVAGATGVCGMARVLKLMPWNRALRTSSVPGPAVAR